MPHAVYRYHFRSANYFPEQAVRTQFSSGRRRQGEALGGVAGMLTFTVRGLQVVKTPLLYRMQMDAEIFDSCI